ncbi:MAG: methylenetetrahydrofolate reductase [NAD(P)H] [Candidatus Sabulitectum sp.]|nr:methylenetetrahydrofolate reductase [NAD(P)H] [Candidatus Sabulitectum sp.]
MRIADIYKTVEPVLSLEVFPPKPGYSLKTVFHTLDGLVDLNPSFVSVTYASQGESTNRTVDIASRVRDQYHCESLAHMTCIGHTRKEVSSVLDNLEVHSVRNVLALRGDMPSDPSEVRLSRDYHYASELIAEIASRGSFCVGAAAYPEGHIESRRISHDLDNLKGKVDAGAEFLITQLFFDNRIFYDFMERVRYRSIQVPVVPGIMPILNYKQIKRILMMCEVSIPAKLLNMFDKYSHDPADLAKAGIDYAIEQISDLVDEGAQGIHLYTMNRIPQIREIIFRSGLRGKSE